jgi:CitMHS family citrate-Mg2+:H+ or citrate-Ca2+:H+ symporter
MLALAGFSTILLVLFAILSKRVSPLVALIALPCLAAILLGQSTQLPEYLINGITTIAPIAVMFMFAILFFSIMNDAGVFKPFISFTIHICGNDPRKLFIGVVLLTSLVHLDGSGASTFLIVIPALLPVFEKLQIDRKILAGLVAMAAGVNNILPWGGPTIRAAAALEQDVMTLYQPLIPIHLAGLAFVLATAFWLGTKQLKLGLVSQQEDTAQQQNSGSTVASNWLWYFNLLLILVVLVAIVSSLLPPVIAFIAGALLALVFNYPAVNDQKKAIDDAAKPIFMMVSILFAAGCFTGVLRQSGMLEAMAQGGGELLPEALTSYFPLLIAILSVPLSLLFDPDSFYFGILPVIAGVATESGLSGTSVAHAALMGQMTVGFPISPLTPATFLLVGLARMNLADHQRFTIPLLFATSLFMTLVAVLLGVIPL